MARSWLGGGTSDFLFETVSGALRPRGGVLTFWSAQSGGLQYTDLLVGGVAASAVRVGSEGLIPAFQGPDGVAEMWAQRDSDTTRRWRVTPRGGEGPQGPPGASIRGDKGDPGTQGERGLPGVNAVPADEAVATYAATPGSATNVALTGQIAGSLTALPGGLEPITITDVSALRPTTLPTPMTPMPTYDGSNVAVHPSILYFPNGWNGYRYWAAMTPYPGSNVRLENPSVIASQDADTWVVPTGGSNPIVAAPPAPAYNSDPCLAMGPDGKMHMVYRDYGAANIDGVAADRLRVVSTPDGVTWSAPQTVTQAKDSDRRLLSPAVWWDGAARRWVMLAVDIIGTAAVKRLTAPELTGPWTSASSITLTPALPDGRLPWHLDAQNVGGTIVMLLQDGNSAGGALYLATSTDQGATFKRGPALSPRAMYKSAFTPRITPQGLALDLFAARLDGSIYRSLLGAAQLDYPLRAAARLDGYVLGDTCARADTTNTLGSAQSGQVYAVQTGTARIFNGAARPASAANTKAVVQAAADGVFSVDIETFDSQGWLVFRASDVNNCWRFGNNNVSGHVLQKIVGGSATTVGTGLAGSFQSGDRLIVEARGNRIRAYAGGVLVVDVTDSFNATADLIGWQAATPAAGFKNLMARA